MRFLRELDISAASGLALAHGRFYVVADDEQFLLEYPADFKGPGKRHVLWNETLPADPLERKKVKADLEGLTFLSPEIFPPHGALMAIPSCSRPNRIRGVLLPFIGTGQLGHPITLDCNHLLQTLSQSFSELNLEGIAVTEESILFFQRGNGKKHENAMIEFSLSEGLHGLQTGLFLAEQSPKRITPFNLGETKGTTLCFSDAHTSGNGIYYLSVAEASESTYLDGQAMGSFLGCLDKDRKIIFQIPLMIDGKPEGLWVDEKTGRFLIVTDADNRLKLSKLYEGTLP